MHFKFIFYPESKKIIKAYNIEQRFADASNKEDNDLPWFNTHISDDDVSGIINELAKKGFYSSLMSLPETRPFLNNLEKAFQNPEDYNWVTARTKDKVKEKLGLDDLVMLAGWQASFFFKPEEVKNYQQFGCNSLSEFTGTIGAFVNMGQRGNYKEGLKWETTHSDGRTFVSEVGYREHTDFGIDQTDITPYVTTDPFENRVFYRPEMSEDRFYVTGGHSIEGSFLGTILRYVHHNNIDCEVLKNNGSELIKWTKSLGQRIGNTTENLFIHPNRFDSRMSIVAFDRPFAKLFQKPDGSYVREEKNWPDCIGVGYGGDYGIFTGPNKEFMICHLGTEDKPEVRLCAKFLPTEISDLLKSLFYQAAKGMGRTSAAELIDIIEYRFSPEFDKDQEEFSSKK